MVTDETCFVFPVEYEYIESPQNTWLDQMVVSSVDFEIPVSWNHRAKQKILKNKITAHLSGC